MKSTEKPLILIVDDNQDILFHLKLILEDINYQIETAMNGLEAIELLSKLTRLPDLIISDIMMPVMDGYEFFSKVSQNSVWNRIPFLFLTAKTTPEDVRLGKMLGVDDYISKPFTTEDLIAIIHGKIDRNKKSSLLDKKVTELLANLSINDESITPDERSEVMLLQMGWDDVMGPQLKRSYAIKDKFHFSKDQIGSQLFLSANFIYGNDNIRKAQGILLKIENINRMGYLFFDSVPNSDLRSGEEQIGLIVIAPKISYLQSLKLKKILIELSQNIKDNKYWEEKYYWERLTSVLTSTSF